MSAPAAGKRRALGTLALVAGSIALSLAAGEVALRALRGGGAPYFLQQIVRWDAQRGWVLVPGEYEFFNPAAFTRVTMSIDPLGVRGRARPLRVAPPRSRLTVVGDSFVFSEGLSEGQLFTDELQRLLGGDCDVVNAGVPGYGTGQELLHLQDLRARGFELGRTVILVFFTNDLSDNAGLAYESLESDPRKPDFEVRDGRLVHAATEPWPPVPTEAIATQLSRRSLLVAFLRHRLALLAADQPWIVTALARIDARIALPRPPGVIQSWYAPGWEERWERTRRILRHLAEDVQRDGTALRIAFMPSPFQAEPVFQAVLRSHAEEPLYQAFLADVDRPQRLLLRFCEEEKLRCIDLTTALRAPRSEPAFFLHEGHLNALGSRLVASELLPALEDAC